MHHRAPILAFALVLASLAACGDDAATPDDAGVTPSELGEPATIALELPAEHTPGEPLAVTWTVGGDVADARVVLVLRGPGTPTTPSSAGYLYAGGAPANGATWWIGGGGATSDAEVVAAEPAAGGAVEVELPLAADGDWAVHAAVIRGDDVLAVATARTWVATGPALRLDVSREWAGSDDLVIANLQVRGTDATAVRLSAWLTTDDGTVLSLPGRALDYAALGDDDGALAAGELPLLAGELPPGSNLVSARLEALDGTELATAGAVIEVCDEPARITGSVVGGGAGRLLLLDAVGEAPVEADVAADGAIDVEVPAGAYLVLGQGDGWVGSTTLEVGCDREVALALEAVPVAAARSPGPASARPADHLRAGPTRRAVRVRLISVFPGDQASAAEDAAAAAFTRSLRMRGGADLAVFSDHENVAAATTLATQQALGAGDPAELARLADNLFPDYYLQLRFIAPSAGESTYGIEVIVAREEDLDVLYQQTSRVDRAELSDRAEALAGELIDVERIIATMRRLLEYPDNPVLGITLDRDRAAPEATVTATVTVHEAEPRAPAPGATVTIELVDAAGAVVTSAERMTDEAGVAQLSYTVAPDAADEQRIDVRAYVQRRNGRRHAEPKFFFVERGGAVGMRADKGLLRPGEVSVIQVSVPQDAPVGVAAYGVGGSVDASTLILDAQRRGVLRFTADDIHGPAKAVVAWTQLPPQTWGPLEGLVPTVRARFYVIKPLSLTIEANPQPTVLNDGYVALEGIVLRDSVPAANVPVAFDLRQSGGQIAAGVRTNASGRYVAVYHAPAAGTGVAEVTATVVDAGRRASTSVNLTYGPGCGDCPVVVEPSFALAAKGGTAWFAANQPVTWSVVGDGAINGFGGFTAGNTGGTVVVRATSVADPTRTATARVTVDCTFEEILGDGIFQGELTDIELALPPYQCSTVARVQIDEIADPHVSVIASLLCDPLYGLWSGFPRVQTQGCSVGWTGNGPCESEGALWPDPDQPGMTHRLLTAYTLRQESDGTCTNVFVGSGIVQ